MPKKLIFLDGYNEYEGVISFIDSDDSYPITYHLMRVKRNGRLLKKFVPMPGSPQEHAVPRRGKLVCREKGICELFVERDGSYARLAFGTKKKSKSKSKRRQKSRKRSSGKSRRKSKRKPRRSR